MIFDFTNKKILITGGTRGIGKQIAEDLYNLNAKIIITGTGERPIGNNFIDDTSRVSYYKVDFTKNDELVNFLEVINNIDSIYGLVNNAGINILNSITNINQEDWNNMVNVNLTAPLMIMSRVSAKMLKNNFGRIVNISSIFGVISKEKRVAYSTTKAGIHGMTQGVSNDLARFNILVNSVSPGCINTDLTRKNLTELQQDELKKMIPLNRLGEVSEISKIVTFLMSEHNTYITGQNIIIDGGFTNV